LRVLRYGLVKNSGGAGKYRGGLGIAKEIMVLTPVLFSAHADRHRFRPWGLKGGLPGQPGQFLVQSAQKKRKKIPSKINGLLLQPGEILIARTAGGGGYGSPLERPPEKVLQDLRAGKISASQARQLYGVEIKGQKVNYTATRRLRSLRKKVGQEKC